MAHQVFISYSSLNSLIADQLRKTLESGGIRCWIAPRDVTPGVEWMDAITNAIDACQIMVLVFSRASNESGDVKREVRMALDLKKTVIPLRAENVEPAGPMRFLLTGLHWQDAFEMPLEPHLQSLQKTISGILKPAHLETDRTSHYFAAQTELIEQKTNQFVGRTDARNELDRFLQQESRGYFFLQAAPGQGKTSFNCQLVKERHYPHHFASWSGGRNDLRLLTRSLLEQIMTATDRDQELPEQMAELSKLFQDVVAQLLSRGDEKLVIVFDGLDELPITATDELPFFSEAPPEGMFVVIGSRPGPGLENLKNVLRSTSTRVPICHYELGPLEHSEIANLLRADCPAISQEQIERIAERSQGNPLYLKAVSAELSKNPEFDFDQLPESVAGFYRISIDSVDSSQRDELMEILGLLSVARQPLSLVELSEITGKRQRQIDEHAIRPIRQFLVETDRRYSFYHSLFREFVSTELLYADETVRSHQQVAQWLMGDKANRNYRLHSLAYHLASGELASELGQIDESFLAEKVTRFGYGVLEDIEIIARDLLSKGDPQLVSRCVDLVDGLREVVGDRVIEEAGKVMQSFPGAAKAIRTNVISPRMPTIDGLDVFFAMLPKHDVSADFFEMVDHPDGPILAIGDAPGSGLKSAFVARFLGNVFNSAVPQSERTDLGKVLTQVRQTITGNEFFQTISMLCVQLDTRRRILTLANASHPVPVLYSEKRRTCERLPVSGELIDYRTSGKYQARRFEIARGDVLVLVTDGLTEGHQLRGNPYGYRFMKVVESHSAASARAIGEAIIEDWRSYPRQEDNADDITLGIIRIL